MRLAEGPLGCFQPTVARKIDTNLADEDLPDQGLSCGIMQNRDELAEADVPVMAREVNMGDDAECDEMRTRGRIEAFMETLGLEKIEG